MNFELKKVRSKEDQNKYIKKGNREINLLQQSPDINLNNPETDQ